MGISDGFSIQQASLWSGARIVKAANAQAWRFFSLIFTMGIYSGYELD
jgi:hypothetical protein